MLKWGGTGFAVALSGFEVYDTYEEGGDYQKKAVDVSLELAAWFVGAEGTLLAAGLLFGPLGWGAILVGVGGSIAFELVTKYLLHEG